MRHEPPPHPPPALLEALAAHEAEDAEEAADLVHIRRFVAAHENPFDRRHAHGHLTGSAFVVTATADRVLLLHHRKLGRWLQPGGHAEAGEQCGEDVALREAREETGLFGLELHATAPRPLDVDVHLIPARGDEPTHEHLDLRYLAVASSTVLMPGPEETRELRWFAWEELDALDLDPGLRRGFRKARRHLAPPALNAVSTTGSR
jgi:8-oxo-dGTP pyrophosphatase MutT (NUDIX family)